jgi:protease I
VIRDDVINAGADYVDESVVRDGNIITSRLPNDLPDFCRVIKDAIVELPERESAYIDRLSSGARASANYLAPAKVKTGAVAPGSANYLMFASKGEEG